MSATGISGRISQGESVVGVVLCPAGYSWSRTLSTDPRQVRGSRAVVSHWRPVATVTGVLGEYARLESLTSYSALFTALAAALSLSPDDLLETIENGQWRAPKPHPAAMRPNDDVHDPWPGRLERYGFSRDGAWSHPDHEYSVIKSSIGSLSILDQDGVIAERLHSDQHFRAEWEELTGRELVWGTSDERRQWVASNLSVQWFRRGVWSALSAGAIDGGEQVDGEGIRNEIGLIRRVPWIGSFAEDLHHLPHTGDEWSFVRELLAAGHLDDPEISRECLAIYRLARAVEHLGHQFGPRDLSGPPLEILEEITWHEILTRDLTRRARSVEFYDPPDEGAAGIIRLVAADGFLVEATDFGTAWVAGAPKRLPSGLVPGDAVQFRGGMWWPA